MPSSKGSKETVGKELSAQMEDYLEAIAHLQADERVARAKDIAERLSVTRATVSSALKTLGEKGLINYQPYSHVTLTQVGEVMAAEILRRHETLTRYFSEVLHLDLAQAEENACRAEHVLDADVIEHMVRFLEFMDKCPRTNQVWRKAFNRYCSEGETKSECKECVGQCLAAIFSEDETPEEVAAGEAPDE